MEAGKPFIFTVTAIVGMEGEMTLRISQQVTVDRLAMIFKVNFYLRCNRRNYQSQARKEHLIHLVFH